jgi:hypothetical protein
MGECINKMQYTYNEISYSLKQDIMLHEMSQLQKDKQFMWGI